MKRRAEEEYQALLSTFSKGFQTLVRGFVVGRMTEEQLRERTPRYDAVARSLYIEGYSALASAFVLQNVGTVEEVADSIERATKEIERRKREQEEAKVYRKTRTKEAIDYINCNYVDEKSIIEARYTRYCDLTAGLSTRELKLRSDSVLCRSYIMR